MSYFPTGQQASGATASDGLEAGRDGVFVSIFGVGKSYRRGCRSMKSETCRFLERLLTFLAVDLLGKG
jgi:hypothetical protein